MSMSAMEMLNAKAQGISAVKETPFSRLGAALEVLSKAENATGSVVTKLCGEQLTGEGMPPSAPVGSGLLGTVEEMAEEVSRRAHFILEQVQRLERRL